MRVFNAKFDASVLKACCTRYHLSMPSIPFTCTMQLARHQWNVYPTKLPDVCRYLDIKVKHHEALSDAMACAQIVIASHREIRINPVKVKKVLSKPTPAVRSKLKSIPASRSL